MAKTTAYATFLSLKVGGTKFVVLQPEEGNSINNFALDSLTLWLFICFEFFGLVGFGVFCLFFWLFVFLVLFS